MIFVTKVNKCFGILMKYYIKVNVDGNLFGSWRSNGIGCFKTPMGNGFWDLIDRGHSTIILMQIFILNTTC